MNRYMKQQIDHALFALKTLNDSIEMAAKLDDDIISKAEEKEIKAIKKAVAEFQSAMSKILRK